MEVKKITREKGKLEITNTVEKLLKKNPKHYDSKNKVGKKNSCGYTSWREEGEHTF